MSRSSALLLALLAGFLCCLAPLHAQLRDEERVQALKDEIQALDGVVQAAKNASEKGKLEIKLQRLREELSILEARMAIESRQRALSQNFYTSPIDALREKLRSIDVTVEDAEKREQELTSRRKAVTVARDSLAAELARIKSTANGGDPLEVSNLNEQVYTKNEEMRALALQRETAELEVELARESERLREHLKTLERSQKPTLKALFDSFTRLSEARKASDKLSPLVANVEQSLQVGESALALAQQKLAKFDEEVALLAKQTGFFSRNAKIETLLKQQEIQKRAISERLLFLAAQVEALKLSQQALTIRRELGVLDLAVAEEQFASDKSAYLMRLRWPGIVLVGLVALYLAVALLILPFFYKNESLFLARRLTRYLMVVLAVGAVASFMFDDLSMVAATMGIVSAALVIALQDVCTSAFGWFVIMVGSKFGIGDRLQVDDTKGDVIDIQLLRTTLLEVSGWLETDEPTGRVILIPNNFIFNTKIFNYSHGHPFIWGKINVIVSFECATAAGQLFERVLTEETKSEFAAAQTAAQRMRRRYGVADATYEPRVMSAITGNDVIFTLFFVSHFRNFSTVKARIDQRLIEELAKVPEIQLAVTSLQVAHTNPVPASIVPER